MWSNERNTAYVTYVQYKVPVRSQPSIAYRDDEQTDGIGKKERHW